MKKLILSTFIIASFTLYAVFYGSNSDTLGYAALPVVTTQAKSKSTAIADNVGPQDLSKTNITKTSIIENKPTQATAHNVLSIPKIPVPAPVKAPVKTVAVKTGIYTDGEYIGDSVDAYYGNIQVKAVITNGALSDVIFLDHPQDRGNSIRINNYAMPILKSEAIRAQSSKVNTVSGATDSSGAFRQSLSSALAQAKA